MISDYLLTDIISYLKIQPQLLNGLYVHFSDPTDEEIPLKYPFRINSYLLFIVISGSITTQINILDYNLKKGDILILPPYTVVHYKNASKNFQQITINFTLDFALNSSIKNKLVIANFLIKNEVKSLFNLSESDVNFISTLSHLIFIKNSKTDKNVNNTFLLDNVSNLFFNLLSELIYIEESDVLLNKVKSRKELLFIALLQLIKQNFKENRNVTFYSNKLAISKSYLNKITKELNNKSVNDLIDYAVITESKFLLSNPDFTITEIAENLNFSDQSSFGKYFKKHTSVSPSNFRKQI